MQQEQILSEPHRVLNQRERSFFFDQGYVAKECAMGQDWPEGYTSIFNQQEEA